VGKALKITSMFHKCPEFLEEPWSATLLLLFTYESLAFIFYLGLVEPGEDKHCVDYE